jgi:hypothetical protein
MHAGGSKERGVNYVSLLFASSHEELADSLSQINEQLENGGFLQARSDPGARCPGSFNTVEAISTTCLI